MEKEEKFQPFRIPIGDAKKFVDHYREGINPGDLKSVWLDRETITDILNPGGHNISGIRLYLAKYVAGVGRAGTPDFPAERETIILALTEDNGVAADGKPIHQNIATFVYDYGHPCPPDCDHGDPIALPG